MGLSNMRALICLLLLEIIAGSGALLSQTNQPERVPVEFNIVGLGKKEISIVIKENEAYLPIIDVFNILGIKIDYDAEQQRLSGFIRSPDTTYRIDLKDLSATMTGKSLTVAQNDFLVKEGTVFLRTAFVSSFFGLDFRFNPRRLRVDLGRSPSLPVIQALMRQRRYQRLAAQQLLIPTPDVYLGRTPTMLGSGRFDWTVSSRFSRSEYIGSRYNLHLGLQVLGGDFTGRLSGFSQHRSHHNDLRGQLRYPFIDNSLVQQIILGDFASPGIRQTSLTGIKITNSPLRQRYYFSQEVFHGQFDPKIDVELSSAISGLQHQQTDEEGDYQFDIPAVYGQGIVEIKAYDPWGQTKILRYRMNLPTTLIQPGKVEYSISIGRTPRP